MSEDSLFGELDLDSAPDDPNYLPDNTYEAYLTDLKVGPTKAGDKRGALYTYTLTDSSGVHKGRKVVEWIQVPSPGMDEETVTRCNSFIKRRLLSLGVPADRLKEVSKDDLIGTSVLVTTRTKGDNVNVNKVSLNENVEDTSSGFGL